MIYSVLIIGCGKIAGIKKNNKNSHGFAILSNKNLKLEACFDIDQNNLDYFSNQFNCIPYRNLNEALQNEKYNIISICSPDHTHYETTKTILNSKNKPDLIFLEKPACLNLSEYYSLLHLSNEMQVPVIVNHSRRFNTDFIQIRNLIKQNSFGELIRINATYYNGWIHNGTHIVDTIIFLFNEYLTFKKINNYNFCGYKKDKTFDILGMTDSTNIPIDIKSIDERNYQLFEFDFWFSKGRIRIENFGDSMIFERPITSNLGENVLERDKLFLKLRKFTEIEFAYNEICRSFNLNKPEILNDFLLQNSESTMKAIFQAMDLSN